MKDQKEDFLTTLTNFIDDNLRTIRALTWVVAGAGIIIIMRQTYVFTWFRRVNDIPEEFIIKGISLKGQVKKITSDHMLWLLHTPLYRTPSYRKFISTNTENESVSNLLPIIMAGIEFRDGSNTWLTEHLLTSNIEFVPLRINQHSSLDCIVHMKKGWLSKICVNEELVRQGFAVTGLVKELESHKLYKEQSLRLLKAEVRAEKRGRGIWQRPSLIQRIRNIKLPGSPLQWIRTRLSLGKETDVQSNVKKDEPCP